MSILDIKRLTKWFGGVRAIHSLDFAISEGEIVGIIGPNGAGKTTLINLITGFLKPDSGVIEYKGRNITYAESDEVARYGIVRTFQLVKPFVDLTVLGNVVIGRLYGADPAQNMKQAKAEAEELLHFIGLWEKRGMIVRTLTLADQRKLELARALGAKPGLLLLDEVIGGLNPVETGMLIQIIKKINSRNITVAFIEHVLKAVLELSTRVIVLNAGVKIAEGSPQQVINDPLVIESYLGVEA
jgi:branched-chain amino acid transport system ATP-binding protein